MVRLRSLMAGVAVVGILAGGMAFAQGPRNGGPGGGRGFRGPMMGPGGGPGGLPLGALNLTDAQREQVRGIREQYREQTQSAARHLADMNDKLRAAVETVPANEALITSMTQDLVQAQVEIAIQESRLNTEVWAVLTPEQQAQATKLRAERQAQMAERRQEMEQRRGR